MSGEDVGQNPRFYRTPFFRLVDFARSVAQILTVQTNPLSPPLPTCVVHEQFFKYSAVIKVMNHSVEVT